MIDQIRTFICSLALLSLIHSPSAAHELISNQDLLSVSYLKKNSILEIDRQAAQCAEELGGGAYWYELDAIVPLYPETVREEWLFYRKQIAKRMGPINLKSAEQLDSWENSANSIEELLKDAETSAPYFYSRCLEIAKKTNAIAHFGPDNRALIKSRNSLTRKVKQIMNETGGTESQTVKKIRDALRGTIIVELPEQIPAIVEELRNLAREEGQEVDFVNLWKEERLSGYVGIHARTLLPIRDKIDGVAQRYLIVEIQIHLKCIEDGTKSCVKEREHLLYSKARLGIMQPEQQAATSTLLYLTALKKCPPKPIK